MRLSLHAGVYTSAIGLAAAGAGGVAVAPAGSAAWVIGWISIAAGAGVFIWGLKINEKHLWQRWWDKRFPERHKEILLSLADPLARFEHLALARAYWNPRSEKTLRQDHFVEFADAKAEAERLIGQIPYDASTVETVRDFMQACSIAAHDAQNGWDDRESRSDVQRISAGLFRFLHEGRSVDRRKVDLPGWCRVNDDKKAIPAPKPSVMPSHSSPQAQPQQSDTKVDANSDDSERPAPDFTDPRLCDEENRMRQKVLGRAAEAVPAEWYMDTLRRLRIVAPKNRQRRFAEEWDQLSAEEAGQPARMAFSELVSRVAFISSWSDQFEGYSYEYFSHYREDPWRLLKREICRPLTLGDIAAWGIKHERNREPENGPTKIDPDFWRRADFAPELMLIEPSIGSAGNGELNLIYSEIVFDRCPVEYTWPLAARGGKPPPFQSIYEEWLAKRDAEHREHAEWINRQHGGAG